MTQGLKLLVEIILARRLIPDDYGTIALVTVFITIINVFVDGGLANALIQKKEVDLVDYSTVFFFNIVWCIFLYFTLFFCAPLMASFYDDSNLVSIIRVLGLSIILSGVRNVQQAYVTRNMQFKRFFFSVLGSTIGAAVIGIWMAYHGFGIWALVAQTLASVCLDMFILWFTVKWRPTLAFSFQRLKGLFSYGWKLLASTLLNTVYNDLRQLIIGKLYTSEDLAQYNRGDQFPKLIITNINSSIDSVLFPTMSAEQDNTERVRAMTRRSIRISTYFMTPMMVGLAVCAEPLVRLVLTDKWLLCVPFLRIFCFSYAFYPIHTANLNAMKALGRSDLFLKLEIIKKAIDLPVLLVTMWFGTTPMAYGVLASSVLSQIINALPNRTLLNYKYSEQIKDMLPQIVLSLFMGGVIYCISFLNLSNLALLMIQILLGILLYIGLSALLKLESFMYIWDTAKKFLCNKR